MTVAANAVVTASISAMTKWPCGIGDLVLGLLADSDAARPTMSTAENHAALDGDGQITAGMLLLDSGSGQVNRRPVVDEAM